MPSLAAGKVVLMDRSRDSSVVYQGVVRGFGLELIDQLNDISTKKTLPDRTLLLDVAVELGLSRRGQTEKVDRLDMEAQDFHQKVREAYVKLAKNDQTNRWVMIDASRSLAEVGEGIWEVVKGRILSSRTDRHTS